MLRLYNRRGRGFDERNRFHYQRRFGVHWGATGGGGAPDRNKTKPSNKPLESVEGWILFVTNLHDETGEDCLKDAFGEYGEVLNINLNLDRRTGFVKGYALVQFKKHKDAAKAREQLNQSDLLGVRIMVDWCFVDRH